MDALRKQTYVPTTGLLVKAGLYNGLKLGSTGHKSEDLLAKVRANAIAKGLRTEAQAKT